MKRLLSLDVLRGITVAGMILVNDPGGPLSYAPLKHSVWNGMTPCDLVFPFFLFMVGVSTYISLGKSGFTPSPRLMGKIVRRAVLIAVVGWAICWFASACAGELNPFPHLRIPGVLPRIALCYALVAIMALTVRHKYLPWIVGVLLGGYAVLLSWGNGYMPDETNVLGIVDRCVFGEAHLYGRGPIDPEGLLSNISAVAHTLIGFCCGGLLMESRSTGDKVIRLFVTGFILAAIGFLCIDAFPLNKRNWSPTFVLATCGIASMLLATLTYFIDIRSRAEDSSRRVSPVRTFFLVFGVNPLFLYVLSEVTAIALSHMGLIAPVYDGIRVVFPNPYLASALYAVLFTCLMGAVGYPLYKRKIYIKL